jgi:DNA mismatch endonuclease (patch repair protein)
MRRIRAKNTRPELIVRKLLRELGYSSYRLHRKDLPGKPDIAYIGRRKAILIHGCFWHKHDCKRGQYRPKSNQDYWIPKLERNIQRDKENVRELTEMEWEVLVIWECEIANRVSLSIKLTQFL